MKTAHLLASVMALLSLGSVPRTRERKEEEEEEAAPPVRRLIVPRVTPDLGAVADAPRSGVVVGSGQGKTRNRIDDQGKTRIVDNARSGRPIQRRPSGSEREVKAQAKRARRAARDKADATLAHAAGSSRADVPHG